MADRRDGMTDRLDGKVVVVTGGASGLGLVVARALAAQGARLALIDVDGERLGPAARSLAGSPVAVEADISDFAQISAAMEQVVQRYGAIDVVIAGAAVTGWGPVLEIDPQVWERAVETNVLGTWRTVRAALPHLLVSRGYLLVVSSGFAASAGPGASAYALSKAAVESLARSVRIEVAHHGVDVGIAYYTYLATPMIDALEANPAAVRSRAAMPWPIRRTYPLDRAVAATVAGIERRAERVVYPPFLRWVLALRGVMGTRTEGGWRKAMPEVEELARAQRAPSAGSGEGRAGG